MDIQEIQKEVTSVGKGSLAIPETVRELSRSQKGTTASSSEKIQFTDEQEVQADT